MLQKSINLILVASLSVLGGGLLLNTSPSYGYKQADVDRARGGDNNLNGADLTGANLISADLTGADLTRAYLLYADLTGANFTCADLKDAYYDTKTRFPKGFDPKEAGMKLSSSP